jgi:hypothetical protein
VQLNLWGISLIEIKSSRTVISNALVLGHELSFYAASAVTEWKLNL